MATDRISIDESRIEAQTLGLWAQIQEDWRSNGRDWTAPGFRALAVHRFGAWRATLRPAILRKPLSLIYYMLYRYIRNQYGIELWYTTTIGRRVRISHQSGIVIHPRAVIGDDCLIRQNVTLGAVGGARHSRAGEEAPTLGRDVEIGAGAVIVGKVKVGDHARIGPNVVITMNVPEGATVFAEPPRIMRARKPAADTEGGRRHERDPGEG